MTNELIISQSQLCSQMKMLTEPAYPPIRLDTKYRIKILKAAHLVRPHIKTFMHTASIKRFKFTEQRVYLFNAKSMKKEPLAAPPWRNLVGFHPVGYRWLASIDDHGYPGNHSQSHTWR
jgi:hypothetical protein